MTRPSNYRATALVTERVKVRTNEMSGLGRTATHGKECHVLNRISSLVVILAKRFWGIVPEAKTLGLMLTALLTVGPSAPGADLTGRVVNGTTKKPAVGDEVALLSISGGSERESANARTDSAGRFHFTFAGPRGPRLVRVVHQGVTYEKVVESDADSLGIQVYEVADKLDGVTAIMDVQRFEARSDTLEVKQLITMRNASKPPQTLLKGRSFEIQLPPEAQVLSGLVQLEDGEPVKSKPTAGDRPGEYYFRSPLRPGDTRFAVVYRLPYSGEAVLEPRIRNAQERFVVMLPKSMRFEPRAAGIFQPVPDVSPDNVEGTGPVTPGQTLAFRISGTGVLAELQRRQQPNRSDNEQRVAQLDVRFRPAPGTGRLDGLILGGLGMVLLVFSAVYVAKRRPAAPLAVEGVVPNTQRRRGQSEGRHKRRARVSQQYSH